MSICPWFRQEVSSGQIIKEPIEGTQPPLYIRTKFDTPPQPQSATGRPEDCRARGMARKAVSSRRASGQVTIEGGICNGCGLSTTTSITDYPPKS